MTNYNQNHLTDSRGKIEDFMLKVIFPILILLTIWQLVAYIADEISLLDVLNSFIELSIEGDFDGRILLEHTSISLFRVGLGFIIAIVTAIPIGIAIGRYKLVNTILGPVVEAMRPIPPIAWIPIAILMFKVNILGSQAFIIWIGAFFPILLNTTAGVKRTSPVHLDVANTFGATEKQVLSKIIIPSASPEIFAGLRIGFGIGWMCLVAAEMMGSLGLGLGYLVDQYQQLGIGGPAISAMIMIGFIGFFFSFLFLSIEKRLLKWRKEISV